MNYLTHCSYVVVIINCEYELDALYPDVIQKITRKSEVEIKQFVVIFIFYYALYK